MVLNDFVPGKPRPLPVFVLADTSGSMHGAKIESLNLALRDMVAALQDQADLRAEVQLSVVTFGGDVQVIQPLETVGTALLPELAASGRTPMGAALNCVRTMLEDPDVVPNRAFTPTLVLVSDGLPTDIPAELASKVEEGIASATDFLAWSPLEALHASGRGAKGVRLAVGIGDDANIEMLQAFVNTPGVPVIRAQDTRGIARFFQWVTLSVTARSVSRNPNALSLPALDQFDDNDLVI